MQGLGCHGEQPALPWPIRRACLGKKGYVLRVCIGTSLLVQRARLWRVHVPQLPTVAVCDLDSTQHVLHHIVCSARLPQRPDKKHTAAKQTAAPLALSSVQMAGCHTSSRPPSLPSACAAAGCMQDADWWMMITNHIITRMEGSLITALWTRKAPRVPACVADSAATAEVSGNGVRSTARVRQAPGNTGGRQAHSVPAAPCLTACTALHTAAAGARNASAVRGPAAARESQAFFMSLLQTAAASPTKPPKSLGPH